MASDDTFPPAGNPGVFDGRQPTLLPNFDKPNISTANGNNSDPNGSGSAVLSLSSPAGFLAANPRADATATATIGGSATSGDILTIEAANPVFPAGLISHTYTVGGSDTLDTIADELAQLFNDDPVAAGFGLRADVEAAVITFHQGGPVGNFTALSANPTQDKITIAGTALTGDQITVLFSGAALGPVTAATVLAAIGGTTTPTDTVALTFTNTGVVGLPITKTYTVQPGDTTTSIASGLAALINADATLAAAYITAVATGSGLEISQQGAIGNSTVVSKTAAGSETVTFTPSSGDMSGGAGQPGGVAIIRAVTTGDNATTTAGAIVTSIGADAALVAAGITATNSSGVITIAVPAAAEPVNITTWVNSNPLTAVIGGTVAAGGGDVLELIFTGGGIAGSPVTVSYTTVAADTTPTIAAALAGLVNSTAALQSAGIAATVSSSTISFVLAPTVGQLRITESVVTGSETITITATPTTTSTLATSDTETITFSNSGKLSGGTGPILVSNNFEFALGNSQVQAFWAGQPYVLGYDVVTAMVQQGMPIL